MQFGYQNICNKLLRIQIYRCLHSVQHLYKIFMHFTAIEVIFDCMVCRGVVVEVALLFRSQPHPLDGLL